MKVCHAHADRVAVSDEREPLPDALPGPTDFDCFYTNPPWGASNEGESVKVFAQRGMEATSYRGEGVVVVADDPELDWPKRVLANLQLSALSSGFYVQR